MRRSLATILAVVVLAGCAQEPAEIASTSDPEPASVYVGNFGEEGGRIDVLVVTTETIPLGGATVWIEGIGASAATDEAGRARFTGLAPSTYGVLAEADGYESATRSAEVLAGAAVNVTLVLQALPEASSYQRSHILKGLISCGAMIVISNPATNCSEGHKEKWPMEIEANITSIVSEMAWTPNQLLSSKELKLYLWQNVSSTGVLTATYKYIDKTGPSPIRQTVHAPFDGMLKEKPLNDRGTHLLTTMGRPALQNSEAPFVAVIVEQSFTIYVTEFYGEKAPDDYSAMPDA